MKTNGAKFACQLANFAFQMDGGDTIAGLFYFPNVSSACFTETRSPLTKAMMKASL